MTMAAVERFTRQRTELGTVPLALSFGVDLDGPEHDVTTIAWSEAALTLLEDLDESLRGIEPRRSLPVTSLRMRLSIGDPCILRLDRGLGRYGRSPTVVWTAAEPDPARKRFQDAVIGWIVNDLSRFGNSLPAGTMEQLRRITDDGRLLRIERRKSRVFDWSSTRSGTTEPGIANRQGYSDLADFAARRLQGKELFPGLGPVQRVVSGNLSANTAELLTYPVVDQNTPFSLVVNLKVLSYPGRSAPVVELAFSKRFWMRRVRSATARELRAFALPKDRNAALQFSLRRQRDVNRSESTPYSPDEDFAPIARRYGLPTNMTGHEILAEGSLIEDCPLFVVHRQGVGERIDTKMGVPDLDKLEAFRAAAELLEPCGLEPWQGLTEIATPTRPIKDRNQKWRGGGSEFEQWQLDMIERIRSSYGGAHHIVVGYHQSCYEDARHACDTLSERLGKGVRTQLVPIPSDVHGPQTGLVRPQARAELRADAWNPFVDQVRRYIRDADIPVNGVLIIAPEWYENDGRTAHDDPVNKRAGRIALARNLRMPVQYLLPIREGSLRNPEEDFEARAVMAWLDLAWKTLGYVDARRLNHVVGDIYGSTPPGNSQAPDRILALSILRQNRTRGRANRTSFIPVAIELDVRRGVCQARFAREKADGGIEIIPRKPIPQAIVDLAASGPIALGDWRQRGERSQFFFHDVITEFCQRASNPLVMIDAVACRGAWPWVADSKLDPSNVVIGNHPHAEADWGDVSIVRVRHDNAPKVLLDATVTGDDPDGGRRFEYAAPKSAGAQVYRLDDSVADVYISFGSLIRTRQVQGLSCYRPLETLKANLDRPRTYRVEDRPPFTGAWSTPSGVELTIVRTASGENPDRLVTLIESLRTLYLHAGDWTIKPAPLFFESVLKEYIADYDLEFDELEASE